MSKRIRVLLLERIDSLGVAGDIVTVSDGYARNFLFSQGKAALASEEVQRQHEQVTAKKTAAERAELTARQNLASSLDGTELTIEARVKDGTQIYGRITAQQIAKEIGKQIKQPLKASDIELKKPLTELGTTAVTVNLGDEAAATVHITVVPEPGSEPKDDDEEA